jgi:hypothetical protein
LHIGALCRVCCVVLSCIVLCCDGVSNFTNPSHSPEVARCIAEVHPSQSAMYASFSPHNPPIRKQSKALRMKSMIHNFNRGTTVRRCTFLRQTSHPCHAFSASATVLGPLAPTTLWPSYAGPQKPMRWRGERKRSRRTGSGRSASPGTSTWKRPGPRPCTSATPRGQAPGTR